MERLERLVVHIEEALRHGREEREPHLRLALLLLDSAAELILYRAVQAKLTWQHVDARLLAALDRAQAQGAQLSDEDRARQAELRTKVLSKTQRRSLERNFDAKAEYLVTQGDLPGATARALRKVHEYRNEAHHRDTVRAGSLRSAVDIYSYLVCTLLRDLNTIGPMVALGVPAGLRRYLGDSPWGGGFEAPRRIAEQLLDASGMAGRPQLGNALSAHLLDRLTDLQEGLEYIADWISELPGSTRWDARTALVLMQVDDETAFRLTPAGARATKVDVTPEDLARLREQAEAIEREADPVRSFADFAEIEDAFEAVEVKVKEALLAIEHEVQLQIDIARGK